jgi:hypothetical protein
MSEDVRNLGDLIKKKGMLMYYVRDAVNEEGINCNAATFSRWCTGKRRPQNPKAMIVLAEILEEEVETIEKLIKQ